MKVLRLAVSRIFYFLFGQIIAFFFYDRKYLTGKWFNHRTYGRMGGYGWRWVVKNHKACRLLDVNRNVPWPVSALQRISNHKNIIFHPDDIVNFQKAGCYFQAYGVISIGHGTYIAPNVGIITSNHKIGNLSEHEEPKPVSIGKNCWIGMNSVILPGVVLGPDTVVGAGAVVTKSFPEGKCVVAGVPARIIKHLI